MNENVDARLRDVLSEAFAHRKEIGQPGLIGGTMGLCMNLYHFSRRMQDVQLETFADTLIDEIMEQVNLKMPVFFSSGLSGIGWGIETLARNAYIEADTNAILKDVDRLMVSVSGYTKANDCSFLKGYMGRSIYTFQRLKHPENSDDKLSTLHNKGLLITYIDMLCRIMSEDLGKLLFSERPVFSKYWDCPYILSFLAEAYRANVFNHGVRRCLRYATDCLQNNHFGQEKSVLCILPAIKELVDLNCYPSLEDVYQTLLKRLDLKKLRAEIDFEHQTIVTQQDLTLLYASVKTLDDDLTEQYNCIKKRMETKLTAYFDQKKTLSEHLSDLDLLDGYKGYFMSE